MARPLLEMRWSFASHCCNVDVLDACCSSIKAGHPFNPGYLALIHVDYHQHDSVRRPSEGQAEPQAELTENADLAGLLKHYIRSKTCGIHHFLTKPLMSTRETEGKVHTSQRKTSCDVFTRPVPPVDVVSSKTPSKPNP